MMSNPILAGFHPDPSITRGHDGAYYVVTSSFEYLPALPVHRSEDLETWELLGHVATRDEQVGVSRTPTPGGVWAPTVRYRDGRYYVIVSVFLGGRGCVVFTADDPAGPWSDGVVIGAVDGIDPDLAWDDDGVAYVTFARHPEAILQVRVDLDTGEALESVRPLWEGSGLYAPEGPHLYRRDGWWYLVAAEGGTDRGHAVTVARSARPDGPFESAPHNPILTAAGTGSAIQNLGHADLFEIDGGASAMVLLGVRPVGLSQAFSPLGRETFVAEVEWADGWPHAHLPAITGARTEDVTYDFTTGVGLEDPEWIAVRAVPTSLAEPSGTGLVLTGAGLSIDAPHPVFVGQRQRHLRAEVTVVLDASRGVGGLAVRNSEDDWFGLEARASGGVTAVTAHAVVPGFSRAWTAELPGEAEVTLIITMTPPPADFRAGAVGGDRIVLAAATPGGERVVLTELDGRHWTFETAKAFTGRVFGVFAVDGSVTVRRLGYAGDGR